MLPQNIVEVAALVLVDDGAVVLVLAHVVDVPGRVLGFVPAKVHMGRVGGFGMSGARRSPSGIGMVATAQTSGSGSCGSCGSCGGSGIGSGGSGGSGGRVAVVAVVVEVVVEVVVV